MRILKGLQEKFDECAEAPNDYARISYPVQRDQHDPASGAQVGRFEGTRWRLLQRCWTSPGCDRLDADPAPFDFRADIHVRPL